MKTVEFGEDLAGRWHHDVFGIAIGSAPLRNSMKINRPSLQIGQRYGSSGLVRGLIQDLSPSLSSFDIPHHQQPLRSSFSISEWREPRWLRASSRTPLAVIASEKPFNTHRLVPAQFNEFYPQCSGTTIQLIAQLFPPEHSG